MRQPLLPIFLTVLVDVLALTIILPLLPFYADSLGATPIVVGLLTASFAVCQLISGPILGRLSDRVGRKRVLLVSQMGTCIGFLVLGSAHTLWMLFLGRIIDGLTAGNLSIAQAYISDVTKPEERTKSFALIGIAFGMGFLIGPAISGRILDERKKGNFKSWEDLIERVKGLGVGNAAKFSAEGLTVSGAGYKGAAAAPAKADVKADAKPDAKANAAKAAASAPKK
jgi:MFS family permease